VATSEASAGAGPLSTVRTVRRIQPSKGVLLPDLGEMWRFKELLYYMLWRDVKARYKQTFLGSSWAILRPAIQTAMQTLIFNQLAGIKQPHYMLFAYAGNLAWGYFASCFSGGAASMASSGGLISKAYFPRLFVPLASVLAPLVDFVLGLPVLIFFYIYFGVGPSWAMLTTPLFLLLIMLIGLGIAFWLAPITVRYRDISFTLPFILSVWFYATPVVYSVEQFKERIGYGWVLELNPLSGVIEWFRWSLGVSAAPSFSSLVPSIVIMLVLVSTGLLNFRRAERTLVDVM
jgi:lipopolysaccharide transport system permease protein